MIKEVIVVEGKDDIQAVKAAVDAEVIATGGYGFNEEFLRNLKTIAEKRGVIILTDPDFAGDKIRREISKELKNCKHAFLPKGKAMKKGDIGVENANSEDILEAIEKARPVMAEKREEFSQEDMLIFGLAGGEDSRKKREELGRILGIGYANSKQFLNRLNNYGVSREEFIEALERMEVDNER
ncbi:MAG: ribonuclease M5 [Sporanaerobacter sp.]|uniref:ribonuclease M5 n=1 Tax=Sporanaerobacter sp. TaxID=2010183 RepID=UPI003A1013FB